MPIDVDRLKFHVSELAQSHRPAESAPLERARRYVIGELTHNGWSMRDHPFEARNDLGDELHGVNLIAEHKDHPLTDRPRFCLGAHLDTVENSPGADDNASAVAALLEIARVLADSWPNPSAWDLELLVFDLEECGMLGGAEHARLSRQNGVDLRGMVSLEMLGYSDDTPGSQLLPKKLQGYYPDNGNFIAVIGNERSQWLIDLFQRGMKKRADLLVEWLAVPGNGEELQATRLSDHSPFWDAGYSALMITDTSFLRNPHYHLASDTPDTLDYDFLARVTEGCFRAVCDVLSQPESAK